MIGHRKRTRRSQAGFTLVELMVALTGGLFISLAVFALARDSGRFYQRESRIASATVSGLIGFERLRTDIARAGFLASPNAVRDPRLCATPAASWPLNVRNLSSIQVSAPATTYAPLTANGRNPPVLRLAGSYGSADQFTAYIEPPMGGATTTFHLFVNTVKQPALLRLGAGVLPDTTAMQTVFQNGRLLRIVQNGRQHYAQIVGAVGGASPTVTVNTTPPIQFRSGGTVGCGLTDGGGSAAGVSLLNVVNFIQYQLGQPQTPTAINTFKSVFQSSEAGPGEAGRTELMRVEQDLNGDPIDGTEELVAEYAIDFGLQFTVVTGGAGCCNPTIGTIAPGSATYATFTGAVFGTGNTPELIRSVRVRLGVRSREPDRFTTIAAPPDGGLFRFRTGSNFLGDKQGEDYARVRTFQADVALQNQMSVLW